MSPEELKTRSNAFVEEVFNRGKVLALDDLFTPDAVIHDPGLELRGTVAMRSGLRSLLAAFPDLHITVEDQIAEGDEVALRYRGEGTHRGEWRGIAPTGKQIRYTGILIQRFEGDKIAEFWAQPDLLGLLQQLGAIPPSDASGAHSG